MNKTIEIESAESLGKVVTWLDEIITQSGATIVALHGAMGAGKTTFVSEYCKSKGITDGVSSPTFSIVNNYKGKNTTIYHFDCYRFEDEREALEIGIYEYLDSGNLCFVEWPTKVENILGECEVLSILIEAVSPTARKFSVITND